MRANPLLAVVTVLATAGPSAASAADGVRLGSDTLRAFQQFDDAADQLARARAAMAAIESGERHKGSARDWAGAPAALAAAAEALKRSSGPALPDADAYAVSERQLRSCNTRADALVRLERRQKGLHAAVQRGSEVRTLLRERIGAAQAAEEARKYLSKTASRLSGDAMVAEAFTWRWADVDSLGTALGSYTGDLRRYLDRVDRNTGELRALESEQAGRLSEYGRAKDCLLAGTWSGTRTQSGSTLGLSLRLVASGDSWTGTANVDGVNVPLRSVNMSGTSVTITIGDGKGTLSGSLSSDGRSYKGTFSSMDGPGPFSLRRQ